MALPDLQALEVFARVAQDRSFTGAAHALGISVSCASYTVRQIEQQLGARLFNRTTRSVSLTEAGSAFLERILPLLEELELAMRDASAATAHTQGTLRLNVPPSAVALVIEPVLHDFLIQYPDIKVDVTVTNSLVDIVSKGDDAGVRYGNVLAHDMVAVPLVTAMRFCIVASPGYLAGKAKPRHPRELLAHECINYRNPDTGALYRWEFEKAKQRLRMSVTGRIAANDNGLLRYCALAGFGFAYLNWCEAEPFVNTGQLVSVLDDWIPREGLYLYYYNRARMPKKLRVFIDFAKAALAAQKMPGARANTPPPTARQRRPPSMDAPRQR